MKKILLLISILILGVSSVAFAQQKTADDWQLTLGGYLWAAGLDTKIETDLVSVEGSQDFSEILDKLKWSGMAYGAAQKDKLSFHAELFSISLKTDISALILSGERTTTMTLVMPQGFVGYELFSQPVGEEGKLSYRHLVGARYYSSRILIDRINGGELRDVHGNWTDFVTGGIMTYDVNERLLLSLRGDVGGFGWGSSSDNSWTIIPTVGWRFGNNKIIKAGYAHFHLEKDGIGKSGRADLSADMSGPIVAFESRF